MLLARKLGMITYRSAEEWDQRFGRERATDDISSGTAGPFGIDFEIESYLDAHGRKFVGAFDANCYLYLSRSMDLFDASDHGGSIDKALTLTGLQSATCHRRSIRFSVPATATAGTCNRARGRGREGAVSALGLDPRT